MSQAYLIRATDGAGFALWYDGQTWTYWPLDAVRFTQQHEAEALQGLLQHPNAVVEHHTFW